MSIYNKFSSMRKMDNSPSLPAYNAYMPANVETVWQGLRNLAAIEQHQNCCWVSSYAGNGVAIGTTWQLLGRFLARYLQTLGFYFVFRTSGAWSGTVSVRIWGIEVTLDVSISAAGRHVRYLRIDFPGNVYAGGNVYIESSTAGLALQHVGAYADENVSPAEVYPDQVRRPLGVWVNALAAKINEVALRRLHLGGWCDPAGVAIQETSKPAIPQFQLYHGFQYAESLDSGWVHNYDFWGQSAESGSGTLYFEEVHWQFGETFSDQFRLQQAAGAVAGGSWGAWKSLLAAHFWKSGEGLTASVKACAVEARAMGDGARVDFVHNLSNYMQGQPILEADWVALWRAMHYGHIYGRARPVGCFAQPGGNTVSVTTSFSDYLWFAFPENSWEAPWGEDFAEGTVPFHIWIAAKNNSGVARTVSVRLAWGGGWQAVDWSLSASTDEQFFDAEIELIEGSTLTPLVLSLKASSAVSITVYSVWLGVSKALEY